MKKIFSLFACLFACFLVVGCSFIEDIVGEDDDDDENKYVWEYGLIYTSQIESIYDWDTFEQIKSTRDRLRRKSYKYHSPSNISESLFRKYLQDTTNMTANIIEYKIRTLNERGNAILYFNYINNQSKTIIWYYIEKR